MSGRAFINSIKEGVLGIIRHPLVTMASINSRPVPGWFEDAKFGIFIHWGIYSVPAYAPRGHYAEWYGRHCDENQEDPTQQLYREYHLKTYGEKFRYNDFVKDFKAEAFDADAWISLFADAGARYMNLVSKHHDGFCMYGTDYAPNWNSVDVGPHRDFCAELRRACEGSPVRFGVYHSVYEWYHPLMRIDPERYALEHLLPMLRELIEKYQPNTLFTDGEWSHPSSVWHSTDFLTWLYNESSVRDFIVPNDRWGSETRGRLGGNLTTEYGYVGSGDGSDALIADRVSEECRGIGKSFGWNKFETVEDYLSEDELIRLFVDLISRGSNLLLNVGPTADGRIPVIMEERLRQIGAWLAVNGEAVYGSRRYKASGTPDVVYTQKDGRIYAFIKKYPRGRLVLNEVAYREGMSARLLGCDAPVGVADAGGKAELLLPDVTPDEMKSRCVYVAEVLSSEV